MTADLETSMDFYRTILGLNTAEEGDHSVSFQTGECTLKVAQDHDDEALAAFGLEAPGADRGRGAVIVVETDDVDQVHQRASEADDCEVLSPPRTTDWSEYICLLRDPDGYVIEVSGTATR